MQFPIFNLGIAVVVLVMSRAIRRRSKQPDGFSVGRKAEMHAVWQGFVWQRGSASLAVARAVARAQHLSTK
jgi:hypothetical protein